MFLLIGPNTLAGQAFLAEMQVRGLRFAQLNPEDSDLADLNVLYEHARRMRPECIINAAGIAHGHMELDQDQKDRALRLNVLLPQTIARVCQMRNISMGHVSSGTIYRGAKILSGKKWLAEIDLHRNEIGHRLKRNPGSFRGFEESDEPNHSFLCPPCDFHSGTVALGEHSISSCRNSYIWRSGLFFLEQHHPQNVLSRNGGGGASGLGNRAGRGNRPGQHLFASVTHLGEFVAGCLDLLQRRAPFGTYHIINPGVVDLLNLFRQLRPSGADKVEGIGSSGATGEESYKHAFLLDGSKASAAGVVMRRAEIALKEALRSLYPLRTQMFEDVPSGGQNESSKCLDSR